MKLIQAMVSKKDRKRQLAQVKVFKKGTSRLKTSKKLEGVLGCVYIV